MILFLYLLKTYLIFILFTIVISLFGGIFVYIFQRGSKNKWLITKLEYFFVSYAVGILIYIQLTYILTFYKLFNFLTAFLPFLIVSLIFSLYLFKIKKINNALVQIKTFLIINRKTSILQILIVVSIFILQFLFFWPKVSETLALSAFNDTHRWIKQTLFIQKYGFVNFPEQAIIYPWGFNFFCAGNLLISPDFATTYFFIKLAGFPFLNFYTILLFSISKRFLKEFSLILFCLLSIFSDLNFLLRSILFLSSTISLLLVLITLTILLTNIPKYLLAFTISGIFLINPIYAFYIIIAFTFFYILKLINSKNLHALVFRQIITIFLLISLFSIVYIISCVIFYKLTFDTFIEEFFRVFEQESLKSQIIQINIKNYSTSQFLAQFSLNSFLFQSPYFNTVELICFFSTIFIIYGSSILSLFIKNKEEGKEYNDFLVFSKIGLILTIIFLFVPLFFEKSLFTDQFTVRASETFFPCIILLAGFFLKRILKLSNKKDEFTKTTI